MFPGQFPLSAALAHTSDSGVLLLTGIVYGLSLWIDKWVFWVLDGVPTVGALRQHPLYDSCFYLGYMTVVPAMATRITHGLMLTIAAHLSALPTFCLTLVIEEISLNSLFFVILGNLWVVRDCVTLALQFGYAIF